MQQDGPCVGDAHLYVGVFGPQRPSIDQLTTVLQAATQDVLLPALSVEDYELNLLAIRRGEDLSRERRPQGLVWDVLQRTHPLEAAMITATLPDHQEIPEPPFLVVHAEPPNPCRRLDGSLDETETVVDFSVRLAEIGGRVPPDLRARVLSWVEQARSAIGAATGYATVDWVQAGPVAMSPYETAVMAPPSARKSRHEVVGYGWGTLLGPDHVARLGGHAAVENAPVHRRVPLDDGYWWLELAADPCEVSRQAVAALRQYLTPVLRDGTQAIEDFSGIPPLRV